MMVEDVFEFKKKEVNKNKHLTDKKKRTNGGPLSSSSSSNNDNFTRPDRDEFPPVLLPIRSESKLSCAIILGSGLIISYIYLK